MKVTHIHQVKRDIWCAILDRLDEKGLDGSVEVPPDLMIKLHELVTIVYDDLKRYDLDFIVDCIIITFVDDYDESWVLGTQLSSKTFKVFG